MLNTTYMVACSEGVIVSLTRVLCWLWWYTCSASVPLVTAKHSESARRRVISLLLLIHCAQETIDRSCCGNRFAEMQRRACVAWICGEKTRVSCALMYRWSCLLSLWIRCNRALFRIGKALSPRLSINVATGSGGLGKRRCDLGGGGVNERMVATSPMFSLGHGSWRTW